MFQKFFRVLSIATILAGVPLSSVYAGKSGTWVSHGYPGSKGRVVIGGNFESITFYGGRCGWTAPLKGKLMKGGRFSGTASLGKCGNVHVTLDGRSGTYKFPQLPGKPDNGVLHF
jgi:hypothetical protein